jgi:hypothetical protein
MTLNLSVRQDILTSWQRCVVAGLRPDHIGHRFRQGADPHRLPARSWLSLTDTERTVAHLAAQGLS